MGPKGRFDWSDSLVLHTCHKTSGKQLLFALSVCCFFSLVIMELSCSDCVCHGDLVSADVTEWISLTDVFWCCKVGRRDWCGPSWHCGAVLGASSRISPWASWALNRSFSFSNMSPLRLLLVTEQRRKTIGMCLSVTCGALLLLLPAPCALPLAHDEFPGCKFVFSVSLLSFWETTFYVRPSFLLVSKRRYSSVFGPAQTMAMWKIGNIQDY